MLPLNKDGLVGADACAKSSTSLTISRSTPPRITGGSSLIAQDTRPRWQVGAFAQYTGPVYDTSLIGSDSNLYAQYTIPMSNGKGNYRIRLGVRNIANTAPPLSSAGYSGAMYNPYGRYLYANLKADF